MLSNAHSKYSISVCEHGRERRGERDEERRKGGTPVTKVERRRADIPEAETTAGSGGLTQPERPGKGSMCYNGCHSNRQLSGWVAAKPASTGRHCIPSVPDPVGHSPGASAHPGSSSPGVLLSRALLKPKDTAQELPHDHCTTEMKPWLGRDGCRSVTHLSLIHISEPTRPY